MHLQTLCKDVHVKRVVFLTDVAGVYDRPPQMPGKDRLTPIIHWNII